MVQDDFSNYSAYVVSPEEIEIRDLINTFFEDTGTTERWMKAKNPLLGGLSPRDMLEAGRGEKLLKFVKQQLSENKDA